MIDWTDASTCCEVYGIPVAHALGCVFLIIAKKIELDYCDCSTPTEAKVMSIGGAVILFGSGLIEEYF